MATETKTYNPANIVVTVGGRILTGFAPGTFVNLVREVNNFNFRVSADGTEGTRTKTNNRSALFTFTLEQVAASNLILSNLANRDEQQGDGVVPISITDISSPDTVYLTGKGWIEKPADGAFAETPQGRAWAIRLADVPMVHGGTPATEALSASLT